MNNLTPGISTMSKGRETAELLEKGTILKAMEHREANKFWNVYATEKVSSWKPLVHFSCPFLVILTSTSHFFSIS